LHDCIDVTEHVIIPKPQHNESLITQPPITISVVTPLSCVLPAVKFDNQSSFQTNKIDDVIAQWLLAAKLVSIDLPKAKLSPE
jgi:hypothetical protein